jgi:hypothetical protein
MLEPRIPSIVYPAPAGEPPLERSQPVRRMRFKVRRVRSVIRELTAPDGTKQKVRVPLLRVVPDGLDAAPRAPGSLRTFRTGRARKLAKSFRAPAQ